MRTRELLLQVKRASLNISGRTIISEVSLELCAGDVVCIVGENGTGKSLLLKLLAGTLSPDSGLVVSFGDVLLVPDWLDRKDRGLQGDSASVADLLGQDKEHAQATLRSWSISTSAPADELSRGERQRVGLALALASPASIVLLDSPAAGLDSAGFDLLTEVVTRLAEENRAVVLATTSPEVVVAFSDAGLYSIVDGQLELVRAAYQPCLTVVPSSQEDARINDDR